MFPLNGAMNSESDFVSAFHHVLLPVLREWKPEVIAALYELCIATS